MKAPHTAPLQASAVPALEDGQATAQPQTDFEVGFERGYVQGFLVKAGIVFLIGVYAGVLGSWLVRTAGLAS